MNRLIIIVAAVAVIAVIGGATAVTVLRSSSSTTTYSSPLSCAGQTVNIGYFPNENHGQALIGLYTKIYLNSSSAGISFQSALPGCTIDTTLFTSGPSEMTALLAGQIDIAFVGPSSAISAYVNSGQTIKIVSGVASGGAMFIVTDASAITNATTPGGIESLNGGTFDAPSLGNTQDVSLRTYLSVHNVNGTTVDDTSNSNILALLVENKTDGAWLPQPYASLALSEAKTHIFLNEQSLWPGGNFSTAEIAVSNSYLSAHPDVVQKIVLANVEETVWMNAHLSQAAFDINASIFRLSGISLSPEVLTQSMATLNFTYDPLISTVEKQALNAYNLGYLGNTQPNVTGMFDLTYLNNALAQLNLPAVTN